VKQVQPWSALRLSADCSNSVAYSVPCSLVGQWIVLIQIALFRASILLQVYLPLLLGKAINGAQSSMPALSARFYPTQCRATGIAWMTGIGRFGAVFGAWIGAVLLGNDWSFTAILSLLMIPATAAAIAIFVKSLVAHTDAT